MKQKFMLIAIILGFQTLMSFVAVILGSQSNSPMIGALLASASLVASWYVVWNILKMD